MRLTIDIVVHRQGKKINLLISAFQTSGDKLVADVGMICQSKAIFRHKETTQVIKTVVKQIYLTMNPPVGI